MIMHDTYHRKLSYKANNRIVCYLSYKIYQETIYIKKLHTDYKYRHNGYASIVLNAFLQWAKTQYKNVTLLALPLDSTYKYEDLIAFYNKFGFIHDDNKIEPNYLIYYS